MTQTLTKKTQGIQNLLTSWELDCKIIDFPQGTHTSAEAAACIGCEISEIAKSLIFKTAQTSKPILILASGPNRVDEKAIENFIGEKVVKADAHFTKQTTGFSVGGVPPFGHTSPIDLKFLDKDLLQHQTVWVAAGTPRSVFNIKTTDLIKLTQAHVISLRKGN